VEQLSEGSASELVRAVIPANAKLGIGFEHVFLVITDRRIIVAHRGKKGSAGLASILVMGSHSGAFKDPDKPGAELEEKTSLERVNPEKVLASHRDNFDIGYRELISVEVNESRDATTVMLLTGEDKFEFFTGSGPREIAGILVGYLGSRLVVRMRSIR
jgi:hypothetical protein